MMRRFLAACVLAAAASTSLRAQAPDRATFYVVAGSDTIARERVSRTASSVDAEFLGPGAATPLAYHLDLDPSGLVTRMVITRPNEPDTAARRMILTFRGDSVTIASRGSATTVAAAAGTMPNFNPSAVLFEQMLIHARRGGAASTTIPAFYPGANQAVATTVAFAGPDSATITLNGVAIHAAVSAAGLLLGAEVPAQRVRIIRAGWVDVFVAGHKDYSAPPGAPYRAEEVTVRTPTGVTLAGTLTLPANTGGARVPAVVTITGSGQENRDEDLPIVDGYHPFRQIADTLSRRGIAVLRLDDRGVGGSSGPVKDATSADFADDIRAAVAYLRTRADIDGARIGLIGHSEGGMIAPMVAAADPAIRAIALMAGPSRSGKRILAYQQAYAIDSMMHVPLAARDSALRAMQRALDSSTAENGWLRFFLTHDPVATARRVRAPVLILQGATDRQVTPDQAPELAAAFRAGGNRDVTVRIFPGTNHLFLADASGNPSGYSTLPAREISREILGVIADWLTARLTR